MSTNMELRTIKKIYGEKFMHLCRKLFPSILENEGELTKILISSFASNSRTLGEDITEEIEYSFKKFISSKANINKVGEPKELEKATVKKNPYELLEEAGYNLYECMSEEEIHSFEKYYEEKEKLCTFKNKRLKNHYVFWVVRKDVVNIKRENYKSPKRDDEYGTSVMSIQFSKIDGTVSIKNRYNHSVNNPDATYGNDLDRIIPGLEASFAELLNKRGLQYNNSNVEEFEIPNYMLAPDGKYYKYNMEINNLFYCPRNVIIDRENGKIKYLKPEKGIIIDYFVLDYEKKELKIFDSKKKDCFIDFFLDKKIEKIEISKKEKFENKKIKLHIKECSTPIEIVIDKDNNIIGYKNEEIKELGNNFLDSNRKLRQLELSNLTKVGDECLFSNISLVKMNSAQLEEVGHYFLYSNIVLNNLYTPKLKKVGSYFLDSNKKLRHSLLEIDEK